MRDPRIMRGFGLTPELFARCQPLGVYVVKNFGSFRTLRTKGEVLRTGGEVLRTKGEVLGEG